MTSTLINVITPCVRVENLQEISTNLNNKNYQVKWYIILDLEPQALPLSTTVDTEIHFVKSNGTGISGNPQRNFALDLIQEGYVYFLDDDNIFHPKLLTLDLDKEYNTIYYFAQSNKEDSIRLHAKKELVAKGVGHVDTAQFLIPRAYISTLRWDSFDYCADGRFFNKVFETHADKFTVINKPYCYYNYLR